MKKIIIGMIIGGIIFTLGGVVATTAISSNNVTYQNKTVNNALDELYDEAETGKSLIATAITNKGISTNSDATYQTMATNIGSIDTDHSELIQKINNLESKHSSDISSVNNLINEIKTNLVSIDDIYPIGSIYISTNKINPSNLLKGTIWQIFGENRMLMGIDTNSISEQTGGSSSVKLTSSNLPSHNHSIPRLTVSSWSGSHTHTIRTEFGAYSSSEMNPTLGTYMQVAGDNAGTKFWYGNSISSATITVSGQSTSESYTGSTGSGSSFSVQNPYITVYMWKRIQ